MVKEGKHIAEEALFAEVHFVRFIGSCPLIVEPVDINFFVIEVPFQPNCLPNDSSNNDQITFVMAAQKNSAILCRAGRK
jgi:hypothetical protein